MKTRFLINNNIVQPPENAKELAIELNYDKDIIQNQTTINNWRWVRENATAINDYLQAGLTGGAGVFEGLPFAIDIEHNGEQFRLFDGYIDLTADTNYSCNDVVVSAKEKQGIDWLNDVADSITFERMYDELKTITQSDFRQMPYVINSIPNYRDAFLTLVTGIYATMEITREVSIVLELTTGAANPFEFTTLIRLGIHIVYIILLVIVLVELIKSFISYIIQPIKYHAGMYAKTLFEKGCQHFGLTFKSSIFEDETWSKLFIIPEKYTIDTYSEKLSIFDKIGGKNTNGTFKGYTKQSDKQRGYYKGTFGDFVRAMKQIFKAKILISDGVLQFEREDYRPTSALYTLPDLRNDYFSTNASDIKANYLISFRTDLNDKNTIDEYGGTSYQITHKPITVNNSKYLLLKGLERVDIPFSLAKRKNTLTAPEELLEVVIDILNKPLKDIGVLIEVAVKIVNQMIKKINKILDLLRKIGINIKAKLKEINFKKDQILIPNKIDKRKGMMLLENDFIDTPKLTILSESTNYKNNKLPSDVALQLSAKALWENFHFVTKFAPETDNKHSQYLIYEIKNVPFTFDNYKKVRTTNKIKTFDGKEAELITMKWFPLKQIAEIKYRVNELFTNNLELITFEPDGN